MVRSITRVFVIGIFLACSCGGCAALPLAAAGTLLGFAGSAASTGSAVYNLGKLDFSEMGTFDECRSASVDAVAELQMHIIRCAFVGKRTDELMMELEDDRKARIDIRIDRRAGHLCACRVDVGIFGSEPTAKLIMERIRAHLPSESKKVATASSAN